ncbi:MAG: Crp/Fnr family transcriptional regulator [Alphaproteobacteria bacterium]|nr:Crp/Fnr family transcriptional regulator [Alphaproteobacteria bacterium]
MADSENANDAQDPGAELDSHSPDDQKFSFGATLDWRRLHQIQALGTRQSAVNKPTTVLRQGQIAASFYILIDGWGLRYRQLGDGRRQILSFLLPGDPVTLSALSPRRLAHSVQLLPDSVVSEFDADVVSRELHGSEYLQACVNASYEHELAMADELLTNLGRRSAKERIAHLMLEFDCRLTLRGAVHTRDISMPLRQRHLADALGLTTIHVNRTLRILRTENLIDMRGGILRILERDRLIALAKFDAVYLSAGTAGER